MKIDSGICHKFLWCLHQTEDGICQRKPDHTDHKSGHYTKCIGGMKRFVEVFFVFGPVKLRNDHRCTGSQSHKNFHNQIDDLVDRSPDSRQSLLTYKTTDNNAVGRVIYLLKKCSDHDRKKENQKLFPDHTFCNLILLIHSHDSPVSSSFEVIRFLISVSIAEEIWKSNAFYSMTNNYFTRKTDPTVRSADWKDLWRNTSKRHCPADLSIHRNRLPAFPDT